MRWLVSVVVLAACAGPAGAPAPTAPAATPAATTAAATSTGGVPATPTRASAPRPAFLTVPLTDVRTGERFTLGGFQGKVVLGIAMAVW